MRVIVCGGRDYDDMATLRTVLDVLDADHVVLVHGACPTGADAMADAFWRQRSLAMCEPHKAQWGRFGKAAGPIRNQEMLDLGADLVIAFPGGNGTLDMVSRARAEGVPVLEVMS